MKVGIMNEPSVEFVLNGNYKVQGEVRTGTQRAECVDGKVMWNGNSYEELLFEPIDEATGSLR